MTEADIHARFVSYYETVAELLHYSLMPLGEVARRRSPCSHRSSMALPLLAANSEVAETHQRVPATSWRINDRLTLVGDSVFEPFLLWISPLD